jgi:tRNA A-37 threonylcarbamoyl transferase component Bud32/tetratricopeptide (TPR) repeat protein
MPGSSSPGPPRRTPVSTDPTSREPVGQERWPQIERLFIQAAQLPVEDRASFLARACGDDQALREEVASLLRYDTRDPSLTAAIQAGAAGIVVDLPLAGTTLGAWRVEQEIGRGGTSVVYLAFRSDGQYSQKAAVKVIKRGMDTAAMIERLRRERRILAALDHPSIARLLDGGTTQEGLPYLVMDYVEGRHIDQWCDQTKLSLEERCRLMARVCDAVGYAHRMLVIHRDLKPGNILVTGDGAPKLLDFGIAKLLSDDPESGAADTRTLPRLLTPEYASPEQAAGAPVGTATDVYSLGVVLFELLSGRRPTGESDRASAAARSAGKPERWAKALEGDLDVILQMALRAEPERRYAGAERLAEDLRRHLNGLPVAARGESVAYRCGKFIRRNRGPVAAAAMVVFSLLAGMATTLWQARRAAAQRALAETRQSQAERAAAESAAARTRAEGEHAEAERQRAAAETQKALAEQRFSEVRELAGKFLFDFHDSIAALPGSTAARRKVVETALRYYDSLEKQAGDNRGLLEEIARGYDRLGDVLGNPYTPNLADRAGANRAYQKALAIRRGIVDPSPAFVRDRIKGNIRRAQMMFVGGTDFAGAERTLREALAIGQQGPASRDYDVRDAVANAWSSFGDLRMRMNQSPGALQAYEKVLGIAESLAKEKRNPAAESAGLSLAHTKLADQWSRMGRATEAYAHITAALAIDRSLANANPDELSKLRKLYIDYLVLSLILRSADAEALHAPLDRVAALQAAVDIATRISNADPDNAARLEDLGQAESMLDAALLDRGDAAAALLHARRALELVERHAKLTGTTFDGVEGMLQVNERLGDVLRENGRYQEALAQYGKAAAWLDRLEAAHPGLATVEQRRAELGIQIGTALSLSKEWQRAAEELTRAIAVAAEVARKDAANAELLLMQAEGARKLAQAWAALGRWSDARAAVEMTLDRYRQIAALRPLKASEEKDRREAESNREAWAGR